MATTLHYCNGVIIIGYTVKTNGGYRAALKIQDDSAIAYIGRPLIRRRIFSTVLVNKTDAQGRADIEAKLAVESGVIP